MADDPDAVALSQLLAALAAGVRAIQGIPTDTENKDDFSFSKSFPEFSSRLVSAQAALSSTLTTTLESLPDFDIDVDLHDVNDPAIWEACADACDRLLDQIEAEAAGDLPVWSETARAQATKSLSRVIDGLVDMTKPQVTYGLPVHNSRTDAFVPAIETKPYAKTSLDLSLQAGHGLESRFGDLRTVRVPDSVVAPDGHVDHVYRTEIESLEYREAQLSASKPPSTPIPKIEPLAAEWIDTESALEKLGKKLESVNEIAIDLEAHSYRTFAGFCCLMQVSVRGDHGMDNYLIDTLKLHALLGKHLQPAFANPSIVKVLHGADSDIPWLQRDFGLYIVNLFDTGRAARALEFSSASYAYLLQRYVEITADKSHQLADWRQRPLPESMQQYAIQDTHYLLDIYERLKWELSQRNMLEQVLDTSKQVSLIRYAVEPFKPDGYQALMYRRGAKGRTELNATQEGVLKALWGWRDATARREDESLNYVCENKALLRIALAAQQTTTLRALQSLLNPIPPLVVQHAKEILDIIKHEINLGKAREDDEEDEEIATQPVGAPSSAFFKPASTEKDTLRRGMMSPVLGTEALYKQAGWMTPPNQLVVDIATTTDEDDQPGDRAKRLLSVNPANKNFLARKVGGQEPGDEAVRGRTVDGMGTARAARESSESPVNLSIEEESRVAKLTSSQIRATISPKDTLPAVLGLITPTIDGDDDDVADDSGVEPRVRESGDTDEEDFPIPRSMREIYKITNRNRRNKKTGSPTPERGMTPTTEKEREELAKAEAFLKEKGILNSGYFDDTGSPGKRARTKSATGRDSEESVPQDSSATREEDLAVIKNVGWIQDQPVGGFDYSAVGPIGELDPTQQAQNPFFAGAALAGGPLAQGFAAKPEQRKPKGARGKQSRRQERPDKKEGRSHAYRKR